MIKNFPLLFITRKSLIKYNKETCQKNVCDLLETCSRLVRNTVETGIRYVQDLLETCSISDLLENAKPILE